jgi:uncharacterized lipoprotein YajG
MYIKNRLTHWILILLLATVLLAGCARGERTRTGVQQPDAQPSPVSQGTEVTDPLKSDLKEMDQMLGDLDKELKNTDTQIEIP